MKRIISMLLVTVMMLSMMSTLTFAKEIIVFQDFEDFEIGETQTTTSFCITGGMAGSSFEIDYAPRTDNKALKIITDAVTPGTSAVGTNVYLNINQTDKIILQFRFMPTDFTQTTVSFSSRVNGSKSFLFMSGGVIKPYTGDPSGTIDAYAQPYDLNEWVDIKLAVDIQSETYDWYFNGKLVCQGVKTPGRTGYFKEYGIYQTLIQRYVYKGNLSYAYIDDIQVFAGEESSEIETSVIPEQGEEGLYLRWTPEDKTTTNMNPPTLAWPIIPMCKDYTIQLSRKEDMSEIAYEFKTEKSVFSPNHTLDTGVWYWRVNGTNVNGTSDWSEIKRFRIAGDAYEFIIPSPEEMKAMIKPGHTRLWLNDETIEKYREAAQSGYGKETYDIVKNRVDSNIKKRVEGAEGAITTDEPILVYPENATTDEKTLATQKLRTAAGNKVTQMHEAAFIYKMTGEQAYADEALMFLESIAGWDPDGFTSYKTQDQVHRNIAFKCAIVYDWLYPLISDDLKAKVLAMVEERVQTMYVPLMLQYPLDELPYDSHGQTASRMIFLISVALLNDLPQAEVWFDTIQPVYYKVYAWGGEDGGYSNGTSYAQPIGENYEDGITTATGFNANLKLSTRNRHKYFLYFQTPGSPFGSFGDEANILPARSITTVTQQLMYAENHNNPAAKWTAETMGALPWTAQALYLRYYNSDIESIPPFDYLNAYHDRQLGWVSMTSDIINPHHTGIRFKSSWWGSYNHSHADQNSFTLYAYSEPLLVDSGYFDYYNSAHDKNYSHKTLAHNAITYNGGQGQYHNISNPKGSIDSKGDITGFLYGEKFNLVSGNAEKAYPELDKANRYLIYLKPDYAVVVDELSSNDDVPMQYEFNLKAYSDFELDKEAQKAVVTRGRAKLAATFQYPQAKEIEDFDVFIGIDGQEYRPAVTALPRRKDHYGVRFDTDKVSDTVMVTTLDILKADQEEKNVQVNKNDECMEIIIDNTQKVYVRLDMTKEEVTYGNVSFKGSAAVFEDDSFMLVNGTKLIKDGVTLISSDVPNNFSYETGELHVYGDNDGNVSVKLPFAVTDIKDENGFETVRADSDGYNHDTMAYKWTQGDDNVINIAYEAGQYNMYLNGTQAMKYDGLTVRINGKPVEYKNPAFTENGTTYVPLEETVAMYDATVEQSGDSYTVIKTKESYGDNTVVTRSTRTMVLKANSTAATFNGEAVTLSKPTILKDGVLYIPLRAYYEVFTDRIGWSDYAQTAWVYTEPVYKDDISSSSWPRTDIMTVEEYEEYLSKKH